MKSFISQIRFVMLLFVIAIPAVSAQKNTDLIKIGKNGRMVWKSNNQEAYFWGVNYTAPFAHAYRQIGRLGYDRKEAIDADTYHLSRLGINAYRIHVWDCEISDGDGNLFANDHLDLLDYLIHKLEQRGIYIFLTPIAYWGNGYPEPNEQLPGFSMKFNKGNVYLEPEAVEAQERYLKLFVNHINPYTRKSYKSDPMILGFEVCNEPGHSKPVETTAFVKRMIKAIKSTGCTKPIFYNVTQSINLLEDFIKGGTDGVTFQWYPAGLVANHEIPGNYLPHVDKYDMPFNNEDYFKDQARLVYEFDAADVGRSYLYPPIALSFKEAGMQWVTMFAYDPVVMAASNTEYQTHFLNMVYSPQKAVGFKIAGEVFRNPEFSRDRLNEKTPFETNGLKISYHDDRSELTTGELFYYTNSTSTLPPDRATLKSIAGYGTSPVISYRGYGAYFLDKIKDGLWRLEVMPDAVWVRDPFSRATPRIENVVIKWTGHEMDIDLPGLGNSFQVTGANSGNNFSATAGDGKFMVTPGTYILSAGPMAEDIKNLKTGAITVSEYYAPPETNESFYFLPEAPTQVSERQPVEITVKAMSFATPVRSLVVQSSAGGLRGRGGFRTVLIPMERTDEYQFKGVIPDSLVRQGMLTYTILAESDSGEVIVFPGGVKGPVTAWDYYNPESYSVKVLPAGSETELFSAGSYGQSVTFSGNPGMRSSVELSGVTGGSKLKLTVNTPDSQQGRPNDSGVNYVLQNYILDVIKCISGYADKYSVIVINGKATGKPVTMEVSLINKDGNAYTGRAILRNDQSSQSITFKDLTEGRMFLLPRPYPGFLPFWYTGNLKKSFNLTEIERIQMVVPVEGNEGITGLELTSVTVK
jgi:Cellulase (glycosyl hydrolase family 5)